MYTLFASAPGVSATNVSSIDFDYTRRYLMEDQMVRYKDYRRANPGYIKSNHLIIRILDSINVQFDGDFLDYYNKVNAQVGRMAGQMGIATSAHHGRPMDGTFYGKQVTEILIATTTSLSFRQILDQWDNLPAVKALSHPIRGTTLLDLDGTLEVPLPYRNSPQVAVLQIDIPLLACQYQLWKLANRITSPKPDQVPDEYFVASIVIPNLLTSHLDIAVLNSMAYQSGVDGFFEVKSNLPFNITDLSSRYDRAIDDILRRFQVQTLTFTDILRNIPTFGAKNMFEAIQLPDIAFTNQVLWALTAARLNLIAFLLRINVGNNNAKNDAAINRIRRSLIEAESGKYLENGIPSELSRYFRQFILEKIKPYL